jgi:succinate dehydrogenase / fumarate reductase, iron-sulfur subunit
MRITLKVWRQKSRIEEGKFETYQLDHVEEDMSFLEMFDVLNEKLITENKEPVAFDHDCREGICGMCSMYINGRAHGPMKATTACQLHMRHFHDGETITVEPWRAKSFPVIKDLVVDRTSFDRIMVAGGYVSVNTGNAVDANDILIPKPVADEAFAAASCIACGACVAACKNSSAMLFMSAKVAQLALLPQGNPERNRRVINMVAQHDAEGFGGCTNTNACEAECPKEISVMNIAKLNAEYLRATLFSSEEVTAK